jgi:protocatechuate 3,4-dioxygenase beta subunit
MDDHPHDRRHDDRHDGGLAHDLPALVGRRAALRLFAGVGLAAAAGCAKVGTPGSSAATTTESAGGAGSTAVGPTATGSTATGAAGAACTTIPGETAGPFPGDGSNGPDVLTRSGVVPRDIRSSFGSASGVAAGVPLAIRLRVVDTAAGCAPLAGAAVYLWHCDREGRYSLYSRGVTGENYLRGVQESAADGLVTFDSIFPAAYPGRWPHIHFEVYRSLADAIGGRDPMATSQLALPEDVCDAVYATDGYGASVRNLSQTPLTRDQVFSDGVERQLGATTGSVSAGYVTELTVPV